MATERAIEYALGAESTEDQLIGQSAASGGQLSLREREVATLIGRGYSNRQVADTLKTSERTVEAHARNIRRKLGLRTRAELIAWAVTRTGADQTG